MATRVVSAVPSAFRDGALVFLEDGRVLQLDEHTYGIVYRELPPIPGTIADEVARTHAAEAA